MRLILLFLIIGLTVAYCSQSQTTNPQIILLENLTITARLDSQVTTRQEYYLVRDFNNTSATEKVIDSFAQRSFDSTGSRYSEYLIYFYKESIHTNQQSIKENRRIIDRYSKDHDLIYIYTWTNGKFLSKEKINNGRSQGESRIRVEDINTP